MVLQAVCMISLPYVNSNWSYSPETAKLGFDLSPLWPWPLTSDLDLLYGHHFCPWYSVLLIYRRRVYRGIGYIAVACWTPFFGAQERDILSPNRGNSVGPIRGRQFFAKSAHRYRLCSLFAADNFSLNQLQPTWRCGLEHMLCDGQPR